MHTKLRHWLSITGLLLLLVACQVQPTAKSAPLQVVVPPNPNMVPLFVAQELQGDALHITVVPVPGVPELAAVVQGGKADVAMFFSAAGAKHYNKETLTDLHLWNVNVWRALFLVADERYSGLDDLVGKKILASFPGGAPDLVMRAAMRQAGYDPDNDFIIEYLPSAQVKQLLIAGKGDAALLPEPQIASLISKAQESERQLAAVVDLQVGFGTTAWEAGLAPLGGIFVTGRTLDDPQRREAFETFVAAYDEAAAYTMTHPDEAGRIVSERFKQTFGGDLSAEAVAGAIRDGRLVFGSRPVAELRPDLDIFLAEIIGQAPADGFYAQP